MYLDRLIFRLGNQEVRNIHFKRGLNLVLDYPTTSQTESGNNVGKTTLLRLIDFALGSDGSDIWRDPEFKNVINHDVYNLLHGHEPASAELSLVSSSGTSHRLRRKFNPTKRRDRDAWLVDGSACDNITSYRTAVRALLFSSKGNKPSLRQLVPKFVRSSPLLMGKTLKFLDNYASDSDYEIIHLFLFGFKGTDVLDSRPALLNQIKQLERDEIALTRERDSGEIEQLLFHLRREIDALIQSAELRAEVPEIARRAEKVAEVRGQASSLSAALAEVEGEVAALGFTIQEFEKEYSEVDPRTIRAVYEEAKRFLPELHQEWSDLISFISRLRGRKKTFLLGQIEELHSRSNKIKRELLALQSAESDLIGNLVSLPEFKRSIELRADLRDKLKHVGGLEESLRTIKGVRAQREIAELKLRETDRQIAADRARLVSSVDLFNSHFAKLSKRLYGEEYLLHFKERSGRISFSLSSVGANVGVGKKASQTAAFDLAYINFLISREIPFPRFVCHDGMESTHGNQLSELLSEAASSRGQLVLATLRDKLPLMKDGFIEENTILKLSANEKFFRI